MVFMIWNLTSPIGELHHYDTIFIVQSCCNVFWKVMISQYYSELDITYVEAHASQTFTENAWPTSFSQTTTICEKRKLYFKCKKIIAPVIYKKKSIVSKVFPKKKCIKIILMLFVWDTICDSKINLTLATNRFINVI